MVLTSFIDTIPQGKRIYHEETVPNLSIDLIEAARLMSEIELENVRELRSPRILFLSHRFPYPPIGGDRVKSFNLLRHLSKFASVDLIALDESGTATTTVPEMNALNSIRSIRFNKASTAIRIVGSLVTSTPIEYAYYSVPEMQRAVDEALATTKYDLVICFFLRTAGYVKHFSGCPKLLIAEDARVILQERATEHFEFSAEYAVRKIDARKLRTYEPKVMAAGFDLVTFVANEDRERIRSADPAIPTAILSNGVNLADFPMYGGARENEITFVGHLGVYHNILMAEEILREIYPLIRNASPSTTLTIVGKDPSERLQALVRDTPGATLYANVPDVFPHVRRASVFVHPQRVGTGIQNKLLEAMAIGSPIVTTLIGASGIEGLIDGKNALIRTTNREIAEATLLLLRETTLARSIAAEARKLIETDYSWECVFTKFDRIIKNLTSGSSVGEASGIAGARNV